MRAANIRRAIVHPAGFACLRHQRLQELTRIGTKETPDDYWASMIAQIRNAMRLNQDELAAMLGSNQSTVCRWEKGESVPSPEKQALIEKIAADANIASIKGLLNIVNGSPFPMILVDRFGGVLAASESSGFKSGSDVLDQTPEEEREHFRAFSASIEASGFWKKDGVRFDYEFRHGGKARRAIAQSILIRGNVFAVVQRLDS
jgi:DNA-binding transcriptional regulator YiaG